MQEENKHILYRNLPRLNHKKGILIHVGYGPIIFLSFPILSLVALKLLKCS